MESTKFGNSRFYKPVTIKWVRVRPFQNPQNLSTVPLAVLFIRPAPWPRVPRWVVCHRFSELMPWP